MKTVKMPFWIEVLARLHPFPSCLVLWGGDNQMLGRFVDVLGPLGHCVILGGGWSG